MNGMAVLTEDSISHLGEIDHKLRVENQWKYHARLYRAASFTAKSEDLEFVQLTSLVVDLMRLQRICAKKSLKGITKYIHY